MDKKTLFSTILFLLILLLNPCARADDDTASNSLKRPDVVFILLDDLRWDGLSFKGHPYVKTPHIDALRSRGASMRNAFVTTSICCPSRATFLTGVYASQHGVIDNETSEYNPEITPPLTKHLQAAGYKTAMIGKWHMGQNGQPRPYFDHWISFKGQGKYLDQLFNVNGRQVKGAGYTTDLLNKKAIKFIEQQPIDQPYFVMLSHKAVHEPFQPAARHKEVFGADTQPLKPKSWSSDFKNKPAWQRRQEVRDVRWDWRTRDAESDSIPDSLPPAEWKNDQKSVEQYRCLAAVDEGVGQLMEALKKRGTLENTLVIFTSDNGYFHWEHRRWDKRLAYEESLRIPMVLAYPNKIEANSTIDQMVANIDFAPTVLDFAGIKIPKQMQGMSMKPLFANQDVHWRDEFFYEYWVDLVHEIPTMVALRTKQHKLIQYPEIDDVDELYDLLKDPYELNNLAIDPTYSELHGLMQQRLKSAAERLNWQAQVFPKNLDRVRGEPGLLMDLSANQNKIVSKTDQKFKVQNILVKGDQILFDGKTSRIEFPFQINDDPSTWPYEIAVWVKPDQDGVIAMQSGKRNGFKLFVQDGRPGIATLCKTWIALNTTLDAAESILGKWTHLKVRIDYNRLTFWVNEELIESRALPQPFKGRTNAPLIVGGVGDHKVSEKVPHYGFQGQLRELQVKRPKIE
ncbi:MAG: sulfatase-like hydrolase/transferase [Mariniblastus sp.]